MNVSFIKNKVFWIVLLVIMLLASRCSSCVDKTQYEFDKKDYIAIIDSLNTQLKKYNIIIKEQQDSISRLGLIIENEQSKTDIISQQNKMLRDNNKNLYNLIIKDQDKQ